MELLLGIVLIGVGVYLTVFLRKKMADSLLEIKVQDTKTFAEVREALEAMTPIDPNYRELVEVKGVAQAEQPITAPYSGQNVAYYIAKTTQVTETTEYYTDSNGNRRSRTRRHEDLLSEEESDVALLLKDESGDEIVIETRGVGNALDLAKSFDRMDTNNNSYDRRPYGRVNVFNVAPYNDSRLIGYQKVERTFRDRAPLYVLGEAYMQGDRIYVGPPKSNDSPFIVTSKSEEQLVKEKTSGQTFSLFGGIAAAVVGVILIIMYFV